MTGIGLEDSPQTAMENSPSGLRVRYPDGREQVRPMPTAKATLGAGAGCNVLIRHPGVAPIHCVLSPDERGWRVRRWSDHTLLNGESFTEAPVEAGDRLQLGPVEVEFLVEPPKAAGDVAADELPGGRTSLAAWQANGCRSASVDSHVPFDRSTFDETLAEHLRRLEDLTHRLNENAEHQQSADQEITELREQVQTMRHELAHAEQLHVASREAIAELERQIADVRQALAKGKSPSTGGFGAVSQVPASEQPRCLTALATETGTDEGVAPDQEAAELPFAEQEASETGDDVVPDRELNRSGTPENGHSMPLLAEMSDAESPESESDEVTAENLFVAEPESDASAESFLDKYQHLLREETSADAERHEADADVGTNDDVKPAASESNVAVPEAAHTTAHHDDDSIESYMARLLQRIKGEPNPAIESSPTGSESDGETSNDRSTAISTAEALQPAVMPVADLSEIKTTQAPERSCDMAALRDLANQSARGAVQTAHMKEQLENVLLKMLVSLLAVICGLVVMDLATRYVSYVFAIGLFISIVGLAWGCRMVLLVLHAVSQGSVTLPFISCPSGEEPVLVPPDVSADEL